MKRILIALTLSVASLGHTAFGAMVALPENSLSSTAAPSYIAMNITTAMTAVPTFDATKEATVDARLQAIAKISGFGYKTANLMELKELMHDPGLQATLSSHGCSVTVPAFHGIASPAIVAHLEANGFNLARTWAGIVETVTPEVSVKAFATKQLPATFARDITTLGAQLKTFFDKQAAAVEPCGFLRSCLHRFFSQASFIDELTPFLEATSKAGQTLIVRSTGMEDKKGLANAGGNESIKHVAPTMPAVLRAVGQVIESYFSEKSFSQRLLAGDKTIFELPATPVLVQVMVSKPASGKRPIECVIHTTDQAGPTPGLASFNCGYNVVASSQRADQCYHFHTGGGHCILAKGVEHVPATVRLALTAVAFHIEHHYQRATDIELLVDTAAGVISIVQARPLNRPVTLASPSYVADLAAVTAENVVAAQTVIAAGSSVRHVTAAGHLIIAPSLATALEQYLHTTPAGDKATVLAVVVQGEAEPNSHEATTFATEGQLVMVAHDYDKITAWHAIPSLNLYLDPQQGVIINSGTTAITIANGYTTHPMPAHISIEAPATAAPLPFAIADCLPTIDTSAIVALLKQETGVEAQQALTSLLARINRQVETVQHDIVCAAAPALCTDAQAKLTALERFARQKAVDMLPLLTLPANDLRRLAAVKPLEVLLAQEEDPGLVDTYSVASVLKEFTKRKTFVEKNPHLPPTLLSNPRFLDMAHAGHAAAMTPELETKWLAFVDNAVTTPVMQQQLTEIWQTLEHFKLTSLWINMLFNATTGDNTAILAQLHADIAAAHAALAHLDTLRQNIGKLHPVAWSQPEKFDSNLATLRELVIRFTTPEFITHLTSDNKLVIAATLSIMDSFVDTFDRSIKALQASSIDNKVVHFKELLGIYYELLYVWAPRAQAHINFHDSWPLGSYLEQITMILRSLDNEDAQLFPSRDFSVSAATLGSATTFERHFPKTAEDVFTLIHQNLLVVTGTLTNAHLALLMAKPATFKMVEDSLFTRPRMRLISITCTGNTVHAHYNLPLQNHSSVFDIMYDKTTNTIQLVMHFVGERRNRWDSIELYAYGQAQQQHGVTLSETTLGEQEVTLTYCCQSKRDAIALAENLATFVGIANGGAVPLNPSWSQVQLFQTLLKKSPYNNQLEGLMSLLSDDELTTHAPLVRDAATTAIQCLNSHDYPIKNIGRQLLRNLLLKGQAPLITEIIKVFVTDTLKILHHDIEAIGLTGFKNLLESSADLAQKHPDLVQKQQLLFLHIDSLDDLFRDLFRNEPSNSKSLQMLISLLDTIITTIKQCMLSSNPTTKITGLLFTVIGKGDYYPAYPAAVDAAAEATAQGLKDENDVIQKIAEKFSDHQDFKFLSKPNNIWSEFPIGGMARPTTSIHLKRLEHNGVTLVVTLTEDPLDPALFDGTIVKNIHLPLPSGGVPTQEQIDLFHAETEKAVAAGGKVVIHCQFGQGRTGTMLALWLMAHEHMTADQAIELVRTQRPGSISTRAQEEFLRTWKP